MELLREVERQSAESDGISYSSASSACEKGAQLEQGLQQRRETQLQSIKPDVISYTVAISTGEERAARASLGAAARD